MMSAGLRLVLRILRFLAPVWRIETGRDVARLAVPRSPHLTTCCRMDGFIHTYVEDGEHGAWGMGWKRGRGLVVCLYNIHV